MTNITTVEEATTVEDFFTALYKRFIAPHMLKYINMAVFSTDFIYRVDNAISALKKNPELETSEICVVPFLFNTFESDVNAETECIIFDFVERMARR